MSISLQKPRRTSVLKRFWDFLKEKVLYSFMFATLSLICLFIGRHLSHPLVAICLAAVSLSLLVSFSFWLCKKPPVQRIAETTLVCLVSSLLTFGVAAVCPVVSKDKEQTQIDAFDIETLLIVAGDEIRAADERRDLLGLIGSRVLDGDKCIEITWPHPREKGKLILLSGAIYGYNATRFSRREFDDQSTCGHCFATGEVVRVDDAEANSGASVPFTRFNDGLPSPRSLLCVPIVFRNWTNGKSTAIGVVTISSRVPNSISEKDFAIARGLAENFSREVNRLLKQREVKNMVSL